MRRVWTDFEIEFLIAHYPNTPTGDIAQKLARPYASVTGKARNLSLKKSEQFLNSELSGRLSSENVKGYNTRFKKGHNSWNKGKKGLSFGGVETRFKPGHIPHNAKDQDGVVSVRKMKGISYQWIRISLGKWELLHRFIWMQEHGSIPEGMIVVFKDGNSMNCVISNLELISMSDNMKRNNIHHYPQEVVQAIQTLGKLNKAIKKYGTQ